MKKLGMKVMLGADTSQYIRKMKRSQGMVSAMQKQFKQLGGIIAGAFAVSKISSFLKSTLTYYDIQAKAETKLLTALKGRQDIQKRLIWQAQQLQKSTIYGDEETINAQALLASLGMTEKQIKMLTPLIQDMATALGMDLNSAASLVGKTVTTTTDALKRYFDTGLDGVTNKTKRAIILTQTLSEKFQGQAKAAAEAGTGIMKQMANVWGDFKEKIGEALVKTGKLKTMLDGLKKVLDGLLDMRGYSEGLEQAQKMVGAFQGRSPEWQKDFFKGQIASIKEQLGPLQKQWDKYINGWTVLGQHFTWNKKKTRELEIQVNSLNAQLEVYENYVESLNKKGPINDDTVKNANMLYAKMMQLSQIRLPGLRGLEPERKMPIKNVGISSETTLGSETTPGLADMSGTFTRLDELTKELLETQNAAFSVKDALVGLSMVGVDAFANGIEGLISGSENMRGALMNTVKMLADFGKQMGEQMVYMGTAKTILDKFWMVPGPVMIAAGMALAGASAAILGLMKRGPFNAGGFKATPVMAYNPVQAQTGFTANINIDGKMRGEDIYYVTKKQEIRFNRITGK